MGQAELRGPFGFVLGQLAKIIVKTIDGAAVETSPKGGLAYGGATGSGHADVIVSDATDHVRVRFDVTHDDPMLPLFIEVA
jgi:hypothetical protein